MAMEIVGVGNALMDVIAAVDSGFAPSFGFPRGETLHLDRARLAPLLESLPSASYTAGGGAANAVRVASILGIPASYRGALGRDEVGTRYRALLSASGVSASFVESDEPTGLFCALIEPGGKRTVLVAPGAAVAVSSEPFPALLLGPERILLAEGFLARDRAWFLALLEEARRAGMRVALDLGSAGLVRANRDFFLGLLPRFCDWLFANEDEFLALVDGGLEEGIARLGGWDIACVVKLGERGALWFKGGERRESPVRSLRPVDETGAGDAFAGGFLAGVARGLAPERCLRLGNRMAEEVLMVAGGAADPARLKSAGNSVGA